MRHGLTILAIGTWPLVEISFEEFQRIRSAKENVMTALAIEEKFEILVESYREYEGTILDLALKRMIRGEFEWGTFSDDRQLLDRRTANLLTAARTYTNQAPKDVNHMCGRKSETARGVEPAFSREREKSLGFRAMEEIRDHMQHRALIVGRLSYPSARLHDQANSRVRFGVEARLDVEEMRSDPRFDRAILAEIEYQKPAQDLTFVVRQYVEGLSRIHLAIRDSTGQAVDDWTVTLDTAIEKARTKIENTLGLAAVEETAEGNYREEIHLVADITKRLHEMRQRYRNLKFLSQ